MKKIPDFLLEPFEMDESELGKYPFYSIIKKGKLMKKMNKNSEKITKIENKIINFKLPIIIDKSLKPLNDPLHKNDLHLKKLNSSISEFCEKKHYSYTEPDIINSLVHLHKISNDDKQKLFSELNSKQEFSDHLRLLLAIQLSQGYLTKVKSGSYVKAKFPLGLPKATNKDKLAEEVLNDYWKSIMQKTACSRVNMILQTSAELEQAEDLMAASDVEIAHNERARYSLFQNGICSSLFNPIFIQEIERMLGEKSHLILSLCTLKNDIIEKFIHEKLYQRAIGLGVRQIIERKKWIHEHEKSFPSCRAIYKAKGKIFRNFSAFNSVFTPITYNVENLTYLSQIINLFITDNHPEKQYWKEEIEKVITQLRYSKNSPSFGATYSYALLIVASAVFCYIFNSVRNIDNSLTSLRIPREIGITDDNSLGTKRVFRAINDLIDHKKGQLKPRLADLAGLFPKIDIQDTTLLIQITLLVYSAIEYNHSAKESEVHVYNISICDSVLTIHTIDSPEKNAVIDITNLPIIDSFDL